MSIEIMIIKKEGDSMNEEAKMIELAKKIKNKKAREWARNNKDKVREINKRYWLKKAKEILEEENKNIGGD